MNKLSLIFRKVPFLAFITIIFMILISITIHFHPNEFCSEYDGVMYRIGDSNYSVNIKIRMDGYLSRRLFKGDTFKGTLIIGDNKPSKIKISLDKEGHGDVIHFNEITGHLTTYGQIYSTDIRKNFIINVFEPKEKEGVKGWSADDGLVIAVPASNRDEAINITDELINKISK